MNNLETEELRKMPEENRWYYIFGKVMNFPGVKVNREEFLRKEFSKYFSEDKVMEIIENGAAKTGIPLKFVDEIAKKVIKRHKIWAVTASAASGIPGGLAMFATIPADILQYYFHAIKVAQELAYIYEYQNLEQNGDEDFVAYLTVFIGVMSGVNGATTVLKQISNMLADTVGRRLPRMALTKTAIYPLVKQIAKWLGIKMTKPIFARIVAKAIPIIGSLISGSFTFGMFSIEANRLKKSLREDFILKQKVSNVE